MRRTASEVLRSLENRVARLERQAQTNPFFLEVGDTIELKKDAMRYVSKHPNERVLDNGMYHREIEELLKIKEPLKVVGHMNNHAGLKVRVVGGRFNGMTYDVLYGMVA